MPEQLEHWNNGRNPLISLENPGFGLRNTPEHAGTRLELAGCG
jgi:hypothetical protein